VTLAEAAVEVRALQARVQSYRFRGAQRYVEDMDDLRTDLGRLARELEAGCGEQQAESVVGADGYRLPAHVVTGRGQVIVCQVRAPRRLGRTVP